VSLREYLGLHPTADANRWQLELTPRVLTPAGAMQGGAALAAAVEALEGATGRPLIWATAQYLSHAGPTGTLDIEVATEVDGRRTTQTRVDVRIGDVVVLSTFASLGAREFPHEGRWVTAPEVAPPDDAMRRLSGPPGTQSLVDHYDIRFAAGRAPDEVDGAAGSGRSALWCRLPDGRRPATAGDVALIGDLIVVGMSDALGVPSTANSLDNTIRVVERVETEWVLLDIGIDAVVGGYGHAGAYLWADDGTLLGMATQTLVMRAAGADGRSQRRGRRIAGG
jgi:acyl-CoA thioesterase